MTAWTTTFLVPGIPAPKGSMRAFPFHRRDGKLGVSVTHDNPKTKGWASLVHDAAVEHAPPSPKTGPISVVLSFFLLRPKSVSEKRRPLPIAKPDVDKLSRLILDACKGILWCDDAQVVELSARKIYYPQPGCEVTAMEMES
jgi:Holliday junction resolvase RusA-like endonuclease